MKKPLSQTRLSSTLSNTLSRVWTATRLMLVFTLVLGVAYPLLVTGIGQIAFNSQANGSLLTGADGGVVGSRLIGQSFTGTDGQPLPQYFQPRPSAAGEGYDATASGGSNQGPESETLVSSIKDHRQEIAHFNDVMPSTIPADALTASASGLDPDISVANAMMQSRRVAKARGLSISELEALVSQHTIGPDLGIWGDSRVNVAQLNLALDLLTQS